ncbi:chitin deacetylase [Polyrhizophydium stewartii]|uniref:Chitin deacetylase n=1 Tax=Polyrhizophydium stewartii TaxID=2732419 RepID=A0ABR4NFQ2_9FUNG|nr:chitin deacetylase [Polyrhizophydium stewartii]
MHLSAAVLALAVAVAAQPSVTVPDSSSSAARSSTTGAATSMTGAASSTSSSASPSPSPTDPSLPGPGPWLPNGSGLAPLNGEWNAFLKDLPTTATSTGPTSADIRACASADDWAFSYDDGPSSNTPLLLDELKKRNIKATFFVVGFNTIQNPAIVRRAYAEGHTIGIHTWSHPHLTQLTNAEILSEILYTARAIKQTIGVTPRLVRPPYGDHDSRVRAVINRLGMTAALWNVDTKDGDGRDSAAKAGAYIAQQANSTRIGAVSLQHDLFDYQVAQDPQALDAVVAHKFNIKRIVDCVNFEAYSEAVWSFNPSRAQVPPPAPAGQPPFQIERNNATIVPPSATFSAPITSPTAPIPAPAPSGTGSQNGALGVTAKSWLASAAGVAAAALAFL